MYFYIICLTGDTIENVWYTTIVAFGREYAFSLAGIECCQPVSLDKKSHKYCAGMQSLLKIFPPFRVAQFMENPTAWRPWATPKSPTQSSSILCSR